MKERLGIAGHFRSYQRFKISAKEVFRDRYLLYFSTENLYILLNTHVAIFVPRDDGPIRGYIYKEVLLFYFFFLKKANPR